MINPSTGTGAIARSYTIKHGDAFRGGTFVFKSPAGEGAAYWDGHAERAQWRASRDGELIHEFELCAEVTEEDGYGLLTVTLGMDPADTVGLVAGNMVGDLEISSTAFPKQTLVTMRANVLLDVTRD